MRGEDRGSGEIFTEKPASPLVGEVKPHNVSSNASFSSSLKKIICCK